MMTQKQVRKTKEGISFGLKVLLGILFISPLIIGFLFSIQYEDELTSSPLRLFTANPTLINYIEVFQKVPLLSYLKNSLIVCVLAITIQITVRVSRPTVSRSLSSRARSSCSALCSRA